MGNKFSVTRLKKLMENGSIPTIVTEKHITTNTATEYNSIHNGTTTFNGDVVFCGNVSGITVTGSIESSSYAATSSYSVNALSSSFANTANTASYALTSLHADSSSISHTASYSITSLSSSYASTSSHALTASSLSGFNQNNYVLVTDFNNYTSSVGTGSSGPYSGINNLINVGPITASGGTQANATQLPTGSYIYRCTSDNNTKGVVLTSGHSSHIGMTFIIINDDATNNTFHIYPPTNGKINDQTVNSPLLLDRGRSVMLICFDTGSSPKWGAVGY